MDPMPNPEQTPADDAVDNADRRSFLRRAASTAPLFVVGSAAFGLPTLLGATAAGAQASGSTVGTAGTAGSTPDEATATTVEPFTTLPEDELELLRFLESLERAGADAFTAAVRTRSFDPPDNEVLRLFGRHHVEQANALRTLIEADSVGAARYEKLPAEPNPTLQEELDTQITEAAGAEPDRVVAGANVLRVLYDLENSLVATYLFSMGVIETQAVAATAASILPVHSQECVVLGQMLDLPAEDDLPSFERDAGALSPTAFPVA